MSLESYKLGRQYSQANPRKEMLREKRMQVEYLYHLAADREDDTLLNGKPFKMSPRIFGLKQVDTFHYQVSVETICEEDKFYVGDYMQYDGATWLCYNAHNFHGLYRKGAFRKCNWLLYFQDRDGNIKSLPCVDLNSTQYNSGEYTSYQKYTLGSTQHMLFIQRNEDTVRFNDPQKFWLDSNIERPTMYKVTQNDNTPYNYEGPGLCVITVTQNEWNVQRDKLFIFDDGTKAWICNYWDPVAGTSKPGADSPTDIFATITGPSTLKNGYDRKYTVKLQSSNGDILTDVPFTWEVDADFEISQTADGNTITLLVDNENCIGNSFVLKVKYQTATLCELEIQVVDAF